MLQDRPVTQFSSLAVQKWLLFWDFRGSPVVRTLLPLQGAWVRFLVGELTSCMSCGMARNLKSGCSWRGTGGEVGGAAPDRSQSREGKS